ncbi:LysR family transcriptional regulator [Acetobacter senegalensis]|uniref:helix-turn-helix domain-containing protein n=1 Tax=Acetobacter senegalensis TaxID=446692 RepID=UPI00209F9AA8|nr:LysR family transcriptional regulator [Acetobacter senegalensis]
MKAFFILRAYWIFSPNIRIFLDISDQGSLVAVARGRRLTLSAVKASLRRLEEHVGVWLISRHWVSMVTWPFLK